MPVFPLPDFVLFPRAAVPLHVFELRYRALVRDALRADRLIAIALLKPGWERDYHGSPAFFTTGCLARVEDVQWQPDDCYDMIVTGLSRVRLLRILREYPYRAVTVSLWPQEPISDDDPLVEIERRALLDACARISGVARDPSIASLPLETLVNTVCMQIPADGEEKLSLLELDSVLMRARQVRERIERSLKGPTQRAEGGETN